MPTAPPTVDQIRAWFPALQSSFAYLENAGGSQVPGVVPEAIARYMQTDYVQLGAGYSQSQRATETVDAAHAYIAEFVNAGDVGKVVLGPSTTALCHILAGAYSEILKPGDEVIIAETNHEANAGPWARLERFGVVVRTWPVDPETLLCSLASLGELLNERTRIVALPHVSNLLGHIVDVRAVCELAHSVGARVVADGVAYAPHRLIDVQAWGVDWYVYSTYKVFGPHLAVLYGRNEAFEEITGPNHFFIDRSSVPYKFELGGVSHEACAGLLATQAYFAFLGSSDSFSRPALVAAFDHIRSMEAPLQERLVGYLRSKPGVRIIGAGTSEENSVGTISFISDRVASDAITAHTDTRNVGIRYGHMYAYRLCQALGIPVEPGVTRASLVHYNIVAEIERLIAALDEVL